MEQARAQGVYVAPETGTDLPYALTCAVLGAVGIYSALFATGFFLYGRPGLGVLFVALSAAAVGGIVALWPRLTFFGARLTEAEAALSQPRRDAPPLDRP